MIHADEKKELKRFYEELMKFKDEKEFHKSGFGRGGPYHQWLKDLKYFAKPSKISSDALIVARYLRILGIEYAFTGGDETKETRFVKAFVEVDEDWDELVGDIKGILQRLSGRTDITGLLARQKKI